MKFFPKASTIIHAAQTVILPVGFKRFHFITIGELHNEYFSPFSPHAINRSSYPALPSDKISGHKTTEIEKYSQLGAKLLFEKNWKGAYKAYKQRLDLVTLKYGDNHEASSQAREDLATVLLTLGMLDEAKKAFAHPVLKATGQDSWHPYRTAEATLDFIMGETTSSYEKLHKQFNLLRKKPLHPVAMAQRYGLIVVANNLGVIASQLEKYDEAKAHFDIAQNISTTVKTRYEIFLDTIESNQGCGAPLLSSP